MQRSAAIFLVVLSSLMLGTTPCCRIHDYAGVANELAANSSQRGAGEFVCPCCNPANPKHGTRTSTLARGCDSPTLHGDSDRTEARVDELPLALPVLGDDTRHAPAHRVIAALARATDVPRSGALTLPLLL